MVTPSKFVLCPQKISLPPKILAGNVPMENLLAIKCNKLFQTPYPPPADLFKKASLRRFKLDRGEYLQDRSLSIDGVLEMTSYFQDGDRDVVSCIKVLPPGECTCSVCPSHMQHRPPVPDPYSIVHSCLIKAKMHYTSFPMYSKSVTSSRGQKSVVSVVSYRFPNSTTTTWQLPRLRESYGEACVG